MKDAFSKRYEATLIAYLKPDKERRVRNALGLGQQAVMAGLQTLDIAKLHEHILVTKILPGRPASKRDDLIRRAGTFFTEAITPIETNDHGTRDTAAHLNQVVELLSKRTVELAARNQELGLEITQRRLAEEALKKSEQHYSELLEKSYRLQEQLRNLSRQIISAQEDERKKISRELHDVIAQTLTGINVRLAALKKEAATSVKGLDRNIARTQRLVEKSVKIVHQFARELRPAVLDDLGLIPALHSFMKIFAERTGIRVHLTADSDVEQLDNARRTALFRIAQEALGNVARHAKASRVDVTIQKLPDCLCMKLKDDGKSFKVENVPSRPGRKRLGLLGMKERLEMVGGQFEIASTPGKGTTIWARIPFGKTTRGTR